MKSTTRVEKFRTTSAAAVASVSPLRSLLTSFLLLLLAVLTVLTTYSPLNRIANTLLPDFTLSLSPSSPTLLPNATLLRLASVDKASDMSTEIKELLDTNSTHRHSAVESWLHFHHPDASTALLNISEKWFSKLFHDFQRSLREWSHNRHVQPGVMTELVDLVKRPIDRHSGANVTSETKRYRTCAVVGNSGILLKHEDGDLIDSHDFVIRLNNAITKGFVRNVGRKTSLAFVNSNILHLCTRSERCGYCHPYGNDVPMIMYICQPVHFLDYNICVNGYGTVTAPMLITDARFDLLCSVIVKYYSLKRFVEKTGKSPEEWDEAHAAKYFHYSSGMQAVMLALGICDEVSIFGFGKSADAKHHYHTDQKKELDLHDYEAEYDLYLDLADRPREVPFLTDKSLGFKVPPVRCHYM